jgi:DNA-binding transcriptional regulator/RsmH inhibitor MraZ
MSDLNLMQDEKNTLSVLAKFRTALNDDEYKNNKDYKDFRINMLHTYSLDNLEKIEDEYKNISIKFPTFRKKEALN